MLLKTSFNYSKLTENNIKLLIDDGHKQKFLSFSLYLINDCWYIDIYENNSTLLYGKIVHTWTDIFELLKIYDKSFPKLKFMAMPSNINGIHREFSSSTAGIIQELFLIGDDNTDDNN